jgi:curved DNA-binding protein CbpA
MTDYFALLDQPRRPWLDADELKQAFHAKSRELHPDVAESASAGFAQLNEAYQVLQDPKRRIQHLLTLEGRAPARNSAVPRDIADLFVVVAELTQTADGLAQKMATATSPLSRSLVTPQILRLQNRIAETLQRLAELHDAADAALRRLSAGAVSEIEWTQLDELYLRFSYLGRWLGELQEKQVRLTGA